MPLYPANFIGCPTRHPCISNNQELVRVIIQFNREALLEKYPGLKAEQFKDHPYRQELASKYSDWINQIQEKLHLPHMNIRHKLDLLVSGIAVTLPKDQAEKLTHLQLPFVKAIYPDEKVTADEHRYHPLPTHSRIQQATNPNQPNLEIMGIPDVRSMTDMNGDPVDGKGVRVAVLDHGFDFNQLHLPKEQLSDQYNFISNNEDVFNPENSVHGNLVTQVILVVAPNAQILAYRTKFASDIAAALERAIQKKAQVVNISLHPHDKFFLVENTANTAIENGIIVVNSSGNNSRTDNVSSPGNSPRALSVGATNKIGYQVADFSNYNSSSLKPDVVAPGYYQFESIISPGTSIAAPYVSGAVALILQMHPNWTPDQVMSALATTATPILERAPSAFFSQGSGRIFVPSAIETDTIISPAHITLEIMLGNQHESSLRIENKSTTDKTYMVRWSKKGGIDISLPPSITVPAQSHTEIPISIKRSLESGRSFYEEIQLISGDAQWHIPIRVRVNHILYADSWVNSVAFSPDGRFIAAGSKNGKIQLWDLSTHNPQPASFFEVGEQVNSVAFHPEKPFIASGSENRKVQLWDLSTHSPQPSSSFYMTSRVTSVAFSSKGSFFVAGSSNGKVQVWDFTTTSPMPSSSFNAGSDVNSVAVSPDGRFIASGSKNGKIQLWDLTTTSPIPSFSFDTGAGVDSVAFSPDRRFIASGSRNKKVQVWNLTTTSPQPAFSFDADSNVSSIAFSPDERFIASGSWDKKVQLWDLTTTSPQPSSSFRASSVVTSIAYSPDGRFVASGSKNGKIWLWKV